MNKGSKQRNGGSGFPLVMSAVCAIFGLYMWYETPAFFSASLQSAAIVEGVSVFCWFAAFVFFANAVLGRNDNIYPPLTK